MSLISYKMFIEMLHGYKVIVWDPGGGLMVSKFEEKCSVRLLLSPRMKEKYLTYG